MAAKKQEPVYREDTENESDSINWKFAGLLLGGAILFHKFFDD